MQSETNGSIHEQRLNPARVSRLINQTNAQNIFSERGSKLEAGMTTDEKMVKLNEKGFSQLVLTDEQKERLRSLQKIEVLTSAQEQLIPLSLNFHGKPCFLKINCITRIDNELERQKPERNQSDLVKSKLPRLMKEKNAMAHITLGVVSGNLGEDKKLLAYSDIVVYFDPDTKNITLAGPLAPFDLANDRLGRPEGFNNTLNTALAVRKDLKGVGLGAFLVEIGSLVASRSFFATERVFPSDSTSQQGERDSFYVSKMGAKYEDRKPFYDDDITKRMPVQEIGLKPNQDMIEPFLEDVDFMRMDNVSAVAQLLALLDAIDK